ncbi:hypothetical protein ZYGR_0A03200 [Zygosaccharomyces rouxii]|uniref:ZYRO0A07260p n=2 Tax=Zygosaccharomyces rouxii TaxID=4956 RepID=C5DPZ0_ZYGRC|nr:uncharacterized protein ZYRO0A07260g [Zygosaccharomyces rouxii]KAH9198728.1 hypothetical protein LQ764DRAFT_181615 [Zygosaccharomyces rouxii]GAV46725.1 hypothetical protein ZYGR_0A03200 [Zygosaccharomyces rouxii]CAR25751.1 ZYRO0A07260p [Zygosaccharomyces rouxii]
MEIGLKKSKHPCGVCARRKVKCDRLIPCTNCIKRGQENECVDTGKRDAEKKDYNSELIKFWHTYEYYVLDVGLFKLQLTDSNGKLEDFSSRWGDVQSIMDLVDLDQSFQLLDYSMERLGPLFFGCLSDIGEIYVKLDDYWGRRDEGVPSNLDECYWDALLWAIFTMAVYYMTPEKLATVFSEDQLQKWVGQESKNTQLNLLPAFTECTIMQLYNANFMANPDIKLIQIYLILCNTNFNWSNTHLSSTLLILCLHVAKMFHIDDFRSLINDSTAMKLSKLTCEKLWYRLCTYDYLQSSPQRSISCHGEISSLLQHAAYLEDLPNTDVNQSEDNFEVLYWKLISLDRDLDQYLASPTKPPLKTLDAIQRQTEIFQTKISNMVEEESFSSAFEKFLAIFLLRSVCWKLHKMYFIFYDTSDSLTASIHHAKSLIALLVNNVRAKKRIFFNKHPIVLMTFSRVASFYAFANIFMQKLTVEEIHADLKELLAHLPPTFGYKLENLTYLVDRLDQLKSIWEKIILIDSKNPFQHPIMLILKNDVERIYQILQRGPSLIRGTGLQSPKRLFQDDYEFNMDDNNKEIALIVIEFEKKFDIGGILT